MIVEANPKNRALMMRSLVAGSSGERDASTWSWAMGSMLRSFSSAKRIMRTESTLQLEMKMTRQSVKTRKMDAAIRYTT